MFILNLQVKVDLPHTSRKAIHDCFYKGLSQVSTNYQNVSIKCRDTKTKVITGFPMRISIAKKSKFSYKNYRLRTWTLKLLLMKQFQVCSQGCSNVNKVVRDFFHQSHRKEMQKQGRILFLTGSAQWMKDSCYPISVIIEIHDFTSFLKDFQPS